MLTDVNYYLIVIDLSYVTVWLMWIKINEMFCIPQHHSTYSHAKIMIAKIILYAKMLHHVIKNSQKHII
jgi:hypothetical protein